MLENIVPFNDLTRIHKEIKKTVVKNFNEIIDDNKFILNDEIASFEKNFSKFTNSKYTVSCANGTDAIELILRSLNIGFGDEVIVPANSFIATAVAVSRCGATPIFVDNDEFYLIDIKEAEKAITKKTKAIIAVNLYGQLADLQKLSTITKKYSLYLIEDSAQSHGAYNHKFNNNLSIASAYSFYPGKNLGAWGDGGAVTTNNKKVFEKIKLLRNVGSKQKYEHEIIGYNSRPQPLLGIVLNEKLKNLHEWNRQRNEIADIYLNELKDNKNIVLPKRKGNNYHVWHLFVVRVKNRNKFFDNFENHKVEFGIHYPVPIHRQNAYKAHKQFRSKISNADLFSKKLLSLPIFPRMKKKEINKVIEVLNDFA